jgi:AGCS family alanine or glycine:cation symporter
MTALVILVSGVQIPYGVDAGAALTIRAFSAVCGDWVSVFLALALCCFAFATILGWGLYGARCAQFLFGRRIWKPYVLAQSGMVILAAVLKTGTVWSLAEILNGLMAVPNLIALVGLRGKLYELTSEFERKCG